jgi:hypothetical protein
LSLNSSPFFKKSIIKKKKNSTVLIDKKENTSHYVMITHNKMLTGFVLALFLM